MHFAVGVVAFVVAVNAIPAAQLVEREARVYTVTQIVNVWTTVTVDSAATPTQQKGFRWRWSTRQSTAIQVAPTPAAAPSSVEPQAPAVESSTSAPTLPTSSPIESTASQVPVPPEPVSNAGNTGSTSGTGSTNSYIDAVLYNHNVHRANHSAPDMIWDAGLAASAQKIADTCSYGHSMDVDGGGYGQNIAAGAPVNAIGRVITSQFYNGGVNALTNYGQPTPSDFNANFHKYGHFTQVVWVSSTTVGCATVDCSSRGLKNVGGNVPPIYHVCNYKPAGNYMGQFDKNVLPSKNQPTVYA